VIETYTWWEIALAIAVFVLAGNEYFQLYLARQRGLTGNVSRLVTHGLVMVLLVMYVAYTLYWTRWVEAPDFLLHLNEGSSVNWTYLLLGLILGIIFSYELVSLWQARQLGRTTNTSRLVTHGVMLVLLLVMIGISLQKWDLYLDKLARAYEGGILR
jgi:hypothetical protein